MLSENRLYVHTRPRVAFSYAKSRHQSVVEFEKNKISTLANYQIKDHMYKASEEICTLYNEIFNETFSYFDFNILG